MPKQVVITTYKFNELSPAAKEKAREWYRNEVALINNWWRDTFEDAEQCLAHTGFNISNNIFNEPNIYFQMDTQGEGACFFGTWYASDVDLPLMKEHAPKDETLHAIAATMKEISQHNPEGAVVLTHRSHHHYHERSISYDFQEIREEDEEQFKETTQEAMRWVFSQLKKERDRQLSNECIDDELTNNDYEFTAGGSRKIIL